MRNQHAIPSSNRRPAFVLVVVLIVIAMLSLSGYAFTELMFTEYKASRLQGRAVQARLLAESGAEWSKSYLALNEKARSEWGGHFNNPERFQGITVSGDEAGGIAGRFSLIVPPLGGEEVPKLRFGLQSESARLNLATVLEWDRQQAGTGRAALLNLPAMTEEIADAILDWMDEDDIARELGAESEFYAARTPPYTPPNTVPAAIEELLWVKGVTHSLLFGDDRNQNGYIEADEATLAEAQRRDPQSNSGQFGWAAFLTLHSAQGQRSSTGDPKIDLNSGDVKALYDQLVRAFEPEWATFIVAYRQFGPYLGPAASASGEPLPPDFTRAPIFRITNVLDLIAVRVQVQQPNIDPFVLPCPFENNRAQMQEYLPRLMDQTTVTPDPVVGAIDVNEAPREVLLAVPALPAGLVEDIIAKRAREPGVVDETKRHVTWLLLEGIVELDQMKDLMKYLTVGGDVFRAQTIGYLDQGPVVRADIVLNATTLPPRLVSWRDLKRLGRGYDLAVLGLTPATDSLPTTSPPHH